MKFHLITGLIATSLITGIAYGSIKDDLEAALEAGDITKVEQLLQPYLLTDGLSTTQITSLYANVNELQAFVTTLLKDSNNDLGLNLQTAAGQEVIIGGGALVAATALLVGTIRSLATGSSPLNVFRNIPVAAAAIGLIGFGIREIVTAFKGTTSKAKRAHLVATHHMLAAIQHHHQTLLHVQPAPHAAALHPGVHRG